MNLVSNPKCLYIPQISCVKCHLMKSKKSQLKPHPKKEFLTNRKFRVAANGCISEEVDVVSEVPQGTVLAAILFVIMISDIDEKVKNCILRSFADDTRVNKKVICNEDKELMQEDLEIIYKWADENKMKFNTNKFEQIAYRKRENIKVESYKTPSGDLVMIKNTVNDLGIYSTNDLDGLQPYSIVAPPQDKMPQHFLDVLSCPINGMYK